MNNSSHPILTQLDSNQKLDKQNSYIEKLLKDFMILLKKILRVELVHFALG